MSDTDLLFGDDEALPQVDRVLAEPWKILIVDDDPEVHLATRLALSDVVFLGRPLEFLSTYSSRETRQCLRGQGNIAIILLDVVMETDDAGLGLVRYIREELGWTETRIILRTGQPGMAPERDVIVQYDINDYKPKSELTDSRLFATVVAALRSYRHLVSLEESRRGLRKVIDAAASLHQGRSMELFASGVLLQLSAILDAESHSILCSHRAIGDTGDVTLLAGSGRFANMARGAPNKAFGSEVNSRIRLALLSEKCLFGPDYAGLYLRTPNGREVVVYIESARPFRDLDLSLLEMFGHNISIGYDNLEMHEQLLKANEGLERRVVERTRELTLSEANLRMFKAAVHHSSAAILITDQAGVIEYVNPSISRTSLFTSEDLIGQRPSLFGSGLVPPETFAALWTAILSGHDWRGELLNRRKNGELYWEDVAISPVTDETGAITNFVAVKEDISHSKTLEQELRRLATVDSLTGILNRRSFFDLAAQEFSHSHRHDQPLAAMMLDIDHFKSVNDAYGHHVGDAAICGVVAACRGVLRERDIFGRYGGEEFACVLPNTSKEQAMIVAERLRAAVAGYTIEFQGGRYGPFTVSVGVASLTELEVGIEAMLGRADAALYEAKLAGRDCVRQGL